MMFHVKHWFRYVLAEMAWDGEWVQLVRKWLLPKPEQPEPVNYVQLYPTATAMEGMLRAMEEQRDAAVRYGNVKRQQLEQYRHDLARTSMIPYSPQDGRPVCVSGMKLIVPQSHGIIRG